MNQYTNISESLMYFIFYAKFAYVFVILLLLAFILPNTRPLFKKKLSDLTFAHWISIFIFSFFWLPSLFIINLANKFNKK